VGKICRKRRFVLVVFVSCILSVCLPVSVCCVVDEQRFLNASDVDSDYKSGLQRPVSVSVNAQSSLRKHILSPAERLQLGMTGNWFFFIAIPSHPHAVSSHSYPFPLPGLSLIPIPKKNSRWVIPVPSAFPTTHSKTIKCKCKQSTVEQQKNSSTENCISRLKMYLITEVIRSFSLSFDSVILIPKLESYFRVFKNDKSTTNNTLKLQSQNTKSRSLCGLIDTNISIYRIGIQA